MSVRLTGVFTRLNLTGARAAISAAIAARTFTAADRAAIEAGVQQRVAESMATGKRFNSSELLGEFRAALNGTKLAHAAQAMATAQDQVLALRQGLQDLQRDVRRPAPLPPPLTDEERTRFISSDAARQVELRLMQRTLRRIEFQGEYGASPVAEQLAALTAAERERDLELVHWLEPRIERALSVAPPAAGPGDLAGYVEAKRVHGELVSRFEDLRDARLTPADRVALTDVQAQVAAIDHEWNRPGGEADLQRAIQHVGVIVPEDLAVVGSAA